MQELLDEIGYDVENGLPPQIEIEEDMPLNETDKAWIREAVSNPQKNVPPAPTPVSFWQKYGTISQWVSAVVAVCAGIGLPIYFHYTASVAVITDEHIDLRVNNKLSPAIEKIDQHTDLKIAELSSKLETLSNKVANLYGLQGKVAELDTKTNRQASLAKLMDPNRVLATVRAEIEMAETKGKPLDALTLTDYKNVVLELPSSAYQYWTTVAAIINYQSKLNQMAGEAPDPTKVSKPCIGLTNSGRYHASRNTFGHLRVSACYIDLESVALVDAVIENSVVRYSGGPISLSNVTFVNCTFLVDFAPATKPSKSSFLLALLNSPKQSSVTIP